MTKFEFERDVFSIDDLIDFCYENGIEDLIYDNDIYSKEDAYDRILGEIRQCEDWTEVKSLVEDIPEDADYYTINGYGWWTAISEHDIDSFRDDIIIRCDEDGLWDYDEEDQDLDYSEDEEEEDVDDSLEIDSEDFDSILNAA